MVSFFLGGGESQAAWKVLACLLHCFESWIDFIFSQSPCSSYYLCCYSTFHGCQWCFPSCCSYSIGLCQIRWLLSWKLARSQGTNQSNPYWETLTGQVTNQTLSISGSAGKKTFIFQAHCRHHFPDIVSRAPTKLTYSVRLTGNQTK